MVGSSRSRRCPRLPAAGLTAADLRGAGPAASPGAATTSPPGSTTVPERKVCTYFVGAYESITPGIFHKLTGALTGKGLQILSAEIHTLADDLVLDRFDVEDGDFAGQPPADRSAGSL